MSRWADLIKGWVEGGRTVYCAFNNTDDGVPPSAVADSRQLAEALRLNGTYPD
jgi:uncharacterized protein YecE (DUF72 family)